MRGGLKYRGLGRSAVLVGALVLLSLAGCAGLTRPWTAPEVAVTSVRPQQLALDRQSLLVGLRIRNPNDRMLPIKAMTYRLSLEGTEIARGGGALDKQIPAFGEAPVEVTLDTDAGKVASMLPALALATGPLEYTISGTASVGGVLPLPYRYSGEISPRELLGGGRGVRGIR